MLGCSLMNPSGVDGDSEAALVDQAVTALQRGDQMAAGAVLGNLLARYPQSLDAWQLAGVLAQQAGDWTQASRCWEKVAVLTPEVATVHANLGAVYQGAGRLSEALASFARAEALDPALPSASLGQGSALLALGRPVEAEAALRRAVALAPQRPVIVYQLGCSLLAQKRAAEARTVLASLVAMAPSYLPGQFGLALADELLGDLAGAERRYRQVLAAAPHWPEAHFNLGNALLAQSRPSEAEACFRSALALRPDFGKAQLNLAAALAEQQQSSEALSAFRAAARQLPACEAPSDALGKYLWHAGQFADAAVAFQAASTREPTEPSHHVNLAGAALAAGDFATGWREYAWRTRVEQFSPCIAHWPWPRWQGEPARGKTVLVIGEQGIGDEVMFASCHRELLATGARVVWACHPRLVPMFRRSLRGIQVVARQDQGAPLLPGDLAQHIDWAVLAGDLPRALRLDAIIRPTGAAWLVPDAKRVTDWRQVLAQHAAPRKVGLAWRGGVPGREQRLRSIDLEGCAPWWQATDVDWIALQHGVTAEEASRLTQLSAGRLRFLPGCDPQHDLEGLLALIQALDGVVSVANAVVHLAGALGRPTRALVRAVPDWRWMLPGDGCYWYRSVTLLRQQRPGDWAPLVEDVARGLFSGETAERVPMVAPHFNLSRIAEGYAPLEGGTG